MPSPIELRPMRRVAAPALAALTLAILAACSTDTSTAPLDANYTFTFHEDSAFQLDATAPSCGGAMYCHRWVRTNVDVDAQLRRVGDSLRVTVGSSEFALPTAAADLQFDSSMTVLAAPSTCLALTLRAVKHGNRLEGTWRFDTDCHDTHSVGTLFGVQY